MRAVSRPPVPLPMAVSGCDLDDRELARQLERYRQLAGSATAVTRRGPTLRVTFDAGVDAQLLDETIAIEQRCCSFLTIDYLPSELTLSISTDAAHSDVLAVLTAALTASTGPPAG